jgi:hypothetical protein
MMMGPICERALIVSCKELAEINGTLSLTTEAKNAALAIAEKYAFRDPRIQVRTKQEFVGAICQTAQHCVFSRASRSS